MIRTNAAISNRNEVLLQERHPLSSCFDQVDMWHTNAASAKLNVAPIRDGASLENAMEQFKSSLLVPVELPAIYRSFQFAQDNDFESIRKLDADLQNRILNPELVKASQHVGSSQLKRLRSLKDHRLIQKYLGSMEREESHGWHTLVYGISLEIYSIPVRQGLINYANRTLSTLLECAAESVRLESRQIDQIFERLVDDVPASVDHLLPDFSEDGIKIV